MDALQLALLAETREQRDALAEQKWDNVEVDFVDQPELQALPRDAAAE